MKNNEEYGCRYFAGGSGLDLPSPSARKQCPAYFRSSNAMAESFNLICISPLNFGRPKAVLLYITLVELVTIYFRCVAVL